MRAAAQPSPFPACEGDTLERLRLLIETSVVPVLGEAESGHREAARHLLAL